MIKRNDGISKDDICQNQFTAYVVLAVKRKRQSYIKKKQRDFEHTNCNIRDYTRIYNHCADVVQM